jgi:hypothetical protein
MENGEQQSERPCSTEISINKKLEWSGKVKAYGETTGAAYDEAVAYAEKLEELLKEKNNG